MNHLYNSVVTVTSDSPVVTVIVIMYQNQVTFSFFKKKKEQLKCDPLINPD